jgi:hypothetical protein
MGKWFAHPASGIDAKAEWAAVKNRNKLAWAGLVARLVSTDIDPRSTADDLVAGPRFRFYRCVDEAMVYTADQPGDSLVLVAGRVLGREDEAGLISEGERRSKLR